MRRNRLIYAVLTLAVPILGVAALLWASLPTLDGQAKLPGLSAVVAVRGDSLGVPTIQAENREDALRALGGAHARDRLFQMELLRRKSAGRLAELFGPAAVELDQRQRGYGFTPAAAAIVAALPPTQRLALNAYAEGVNAFLNQATLLPPEFWLLRHRPEPWRPEDSILVALAMFQTLNGHEEDDERMLTVMEQALPAAVTAFLTPDAGEYDTVLLGGAQSRRPARPLPLAEWAGLGQAPLAAGAVDALAISAGSNNWAVAGSRTRDGRAIIANDMHLTLGVPNIWYRAALRYAGRALDGVTLPGVPLLVVGGNGQLAWGFTNVDADVLDLVMLDINPDNPNEYGTPQGWQAFERRTETIHVKGGADVRLDVDGTIWGPVSPRPLLGRRVALRWTALNAWGVDLGMLDLDRAETVEQGVAVVNRAGGPTQNVAFADSQGQIGWSLLGRYPLRRGFDGAVSRSWADGAIGWDGAIAPDALPRLLNPEQGYLATANNRTLGSAYPYAIGHNQAHGYRAHRIAERLADLRQAGERDLLAVQLDTRSEFFEYYRALALEVLADAGDADLQEARGQIEAWDGRMDAGSSGIALLWAWREKLADTVFAPVVARCRQAQPDFHYAWRQMETPLRELLKQRQAETLPSSHYRDWPDLLRQTLADSAGELKQRHGAANPADLSWGAVNRTPIRHPFSKTLPW
ncbi:MAG: penicillin acylase family protein, partial [Candidatus Methylumidiphilus sp.]